MDISKSDLKFSKRKFKASENNFPSLLSFSKIVLKITLACPLSSEKFPKLAFLWITNGLKSLSAKLLVESISKSSTNKKKLFDLIFYLYILIKVFLKI